jgi:hypothetical protein
MQGERPSHEAEILQVLPMGSQCLLLWWFRKEHTGEVTLEMASWKEGLLPFTKCVFLGKALHRGKCQST